MSAAETHRRVAEQARSEMMRDLANPKTIPALAKLCGVSPTTLKDAFRETYGTSLYAWYRAFRIECASKLLLEGDRTVAQVAAEVGYSNPSKFAKAFIAYVGMTPHEWRTSAQD